MTLDQLMDGIKDYFGDTTRSQAETAEGLRTMADECTQLADAIDATDN